MTLAQRLQSKNARVRAEAKRQQAKHEELRREIGERVVSPSSELTQMAHNSRSCPLTHSAPRRYWMESWP